MTDAEIIQKSLEMIESIARTMEESERARKEMVERIRNRAAERIRNATKGKDTTQDEI